jgi:hypothetical protein
MEAILKVPYNYSDPAHDFDSSEEFIHDGSMESNLKWAKIKQEHEKLMLETYNKYKPMIDRNIRRLGQNIAINNEGEKERTNFSQQKTYFTETKVIVRDINNKPINIDVLLEYHKTKEPFIIDLQMPIYDQNEELEPEVKAWKRETNRINREVYDAADRLRGFSKRDFRLEFPDSKSSALLKDTKMVDIVNNHTFMFLVDQIIFSKN